jgi:DNA-binding beta-propeller fold protein YncE
MAASDTGPSGFDSAGTDHAPEGSQPNPEIVEGLDDPRPPATPELPVGARKLKQARTTRKILLLALLLVLLGLLGYVAWYFSVNKRLPIPTTITARQAEMEPPQYLYSISGEGRQRVNRPLGVVVGKDGRVYVADPVSRAIKVYTNAGAFLFQFRALKDGAVTALDAPVHMALDAEGNVWVTDRMLHGLYVFSPEGKFLREFLPNGDPKARWSPLAIWIDPQGNVYVTDVAETQKHRVRVFDSTGKEIASWGQTAQVLNAQSAAGSFYFPNGIVSRGTGPKSDIYVVDGDNRRLQVFGPDGKFKRFVVTQGVPRGIALDRQTPKGEVIVVADATANMADIYSLTGQHLTSFGQGGVFEGQFQFPNDVAIDSAGKIFITDRSNNRVQVWGFPKGEITGITKLPAGIPPWVCLLPLLLLPLLLLFRKRKFVVTPDFVEGMITADAVRAMDNRRFRWIIKEGDYPAFSDLVVDGVNLGELLDPEPYSYSDAQDLAGRLQIELELAGLLAMARRYKRLCTEDDEVARLAIALDVEVFDRVAWLDKYGPKTPQMPEATPPPTRPAE